MSQSFIPVPPDLTRNTSASEAVIGRIAFGPLDRTATDRSLPIRHSVEAPCTPLIRVDSYLVRRCPHCGSDNLVLSDWYLDDEEVDAIECNDCYAGAPVRIWNQRA